MASHLANRVEKNGPILPDCNCKHAVGDKAHANNCGKSVVPRATGENDAESGAKTLVVYTDLFCSDPKFNFSHEDSDPVSPKIYHHGGTKKH